MDWLALDRLDQKRRSVLTKRGLAELTPAFQSWDQFDQLAQISEGEWEAVLAGDLLPEQLIPDEQEVEVDVQPSTWG